MQLRISLLNQWRPQLEGQIAGANSLRTERRFAAAGAWQSVVHDDVEPLSVLVEAEAIQASASQLGIPKQARVNADLLPVPIPRVVSKQQALSQRQRAERTHKPAVAKGAGSNPPQLAGKRGRGRNFRRTKPTYLGFRGELRRVLRHRIPSVDRSRPLWVRSRGPEFWVLEQLANLQLGHQLVRPLQRRLQRGQDGRAAVEVVVPQTQGVRRARRLDRLLRGGGQLPEGLVEGVAGAGAGSALRQRARGRGAKARPL
mmetsp:Transcript_144254/g.461991  ORF Transcript_144254/g.461991 Transcript_144254/m.461991 type:complete len:257 (+) Transcript_144254:1347-2117(+)